MAEFRLEQVFASKPVWRLLRVLLRPPFMAHSFTQLQCATSLPKGSVVPSLRRLIAAGVVQHREQGYRANTQQSLTALLWRLLQEEQCRHLEPQLRNALELFLAGQNYAPQAAVLFGSAARGLADSTSDVDICLVDERGSSGRFPELPYWFEVHAYSPAAFRSPEDAVVLDALLHGVVLLGHSLVYEVLTSLRSFPKAYLLHRLHQAKGFYDRSKNLSGVAAEYYGDLARTTTAQLESILHQGRTVSRKEIGQTWDRDVNLGEIWQQLSRELAKEGEHIWLT